MTNNLERDQSRGPIFVRLNLYAEYELLMLTGVFFWYQLIYTILYEFNWKYILIWSWLSACQYFFYMRSYDRLEVYRKTKWYHALPHWLFAIACIYFLFNRISIAEYLDSAGK